MITGIFAPKKLIAEGQGIICHGINDSQRFQTDTHIADLLSAVLEALLNYDSGTFESSSGFLYNIDQSEKSTAICKEIINKKYVILRTKELLGNNND